MKKKFLTAMLCICMAALMMACGDEKQKPNGTSTNTATDSNAPATEEPVLEEEDDNFEEFDTEGEEGGLEIYTIDTESLEIAPLSVAIKDEKVTAQAIVNAVVDNLDEKVSIHKVITKKKTVIVSFKNGKAPLAGCSGQVEELILDCISNSLLDNLADCENVVFQSEDGAYESGHLAFDLNEVYASK